MASSQNVPDYPNEIISLPMFHPDICCRQQAETYVLQHNLGEGSYLIRPNTENDPSYVSITTSISGNRICNAKVHIEKNNKGLMYFISEKLKFPTFNALLSYYCEHRIHCKQGIDNLRLVRPLRKINQQQQYKSSAYIGEDRRVSNTSLDSGDNSKGNKQPSKEIQDRRDIWGKARANSESQILPPPNALSSLKKHGGSFNRYPPSRGIKHGNSNHQNSTLTHSASETHFEDQHSSKGSSYNFLNYANSVSIKQDPKSLMKCRPPAPLPRPNEQSSDDAYYYTSIDATKDFFRETYQFLKDNETCECGLRLSDSELALGWTIHRSHDAATLNYIFFQHGEITTWDMPIDLVCNLTLEQVKFIVYLCREGKQPVPLCLRDRLDREMGKRLSDKRQYRL